MDTAVKRHGRDAAADRTEAVTRVIDEMRADPGRPQPLVQLARTGMFSPFHFHRIFRDTTAVTPARFLAALRISEARRLLLHSTMPVSRVGSRVGYASTGSFITHFGQCVGLPPARFRSLVRSLGDSRVGERLPALSPPAGTRTGAEVGWCAQPVPYSLAVSWLFRPGRSPGRPCLARLAAGTPRVCLPRAAGPGTYWAVTMVVPAEVRLVDALVDDVPGSYLIGRTRLSLAGAHVSVTVRMELRSPEPTDPPIAAVTPLCWLQR